MQPITTFVWIANGIGFGVREAFESKRTILNTTAPGGSFIQYHREKDSLEAMLGSNLDEASKTYLGEV